MLSAGTRLGPYEVLSPLGAGGMGEVYRARDTRLDRTVAIKILPAHLSGDPKARQRFEREAKAISSLNHPHICTLHDVGSQAGTDFLVMECLEGETLADRLARGRLPVDQALTIAIQVLDALDKAHRQGIIHRDLKPGNIMLAKTGAKLMDFGLAKPMAAVLGGAGGLPGSAAGATPRPGGSFPSSPTMTVADLASAGSPLTQQGTIVGTFQYVAPEVLQGREADARSDLFAFGCVLYEMLTGRRAFEGKSQLSVLTAILEHEPAAPSALLPATPAALDRVVRACLAKDPEARFQTAHDVGLQLKWIRDEGARSAALPAGGRAIRPWTLAAAAAVVVVALAAAVLAGRRWQETPAPAYQFETNAPGKTVFNFRGLSGPPVMAPDGRNLVFAAAVPDQPGSRILWLRSFDSSETRPLPGTERGTFPFWSPEGRVFGFFSDGKLRKYDLGAGNAIALCDAPEGRGGAWTTGGEIIFGSRDDGLFRVSAAGGEAKVLTTPDAGRQETSHRWPMLLPDEKHLLFVAQAPEARLLSISIGDPKPVPFADLTMQVYFAEGQLLYVTDTTLFARPFDPRQLKFTGEPVVLAEHVQSDPQFNYAAFSASGPALAYQTGAIPAETRLGGLDRSGRETPLYREPVLVPDIHLSPAEDRIVASVGPTSATDIWIYNLARTGKTRLTFDQHSGSPVWSPDGAQVAFSRPASKGTEVVVKSASGGGSEEVVFRDEAARSIALFGWSPEGYLAAIVTHETREIRAIALRGGHESIGPLTLGPPPERASLSPDGRWLAYSAGEGGVKEVYVVPFRPGAAPGAGGGKWQISSGGGSAPVWRPDGKELFFTNISMTSMFSCRVDTTGDRFQNDAPQLLFELGAHVSGTFYAPGRDGQRIYVTNYGPGSTSPITVTVNWPRLLKK
jgi:Tol biopolymer transport system component